MNKQVPYLLMILMIVFAIAGYSVGMAFGEEPNIALELYLEQKFIEQKTITVTGVANPFEVTIEEINLLAYQEAVSKESENIGKKFVEYCDVNSGLCQYVWEQPQIYFDKDGNIINLACGKGTYYNVTMNTCELTDMEKRVIQAWAFVLIIIVLVSFTVFIIWIRNRKQKYNLEGAD